ncbi:MAG: class II fumarate hydratase [Desulfosalsimonadaceae bacterium]
MKKMIYREEFDSLGPVKVPADAYYGAQTQRALDHFTISGIRFPSFFIANIALIKKHAATVNNALGLIDAKKAEAIYNAACMVMDGCFDDSFVLDVFQSGSGTNTNMNVNEVIATRANELLTGKRRTRSPVHPNDHVNCCQSSNDVFPSATRMTALTRITRSLLPAILKLHESLEKKARAFSHIKKVGRTHLQDAVVMSLGDEFSGYARQAQLAVERLESVRKRLLALPLGGTAVGTGINAHKEFAPRVIARIAEESGFDFYEAENHFEAQSCMDTAVEAMGVLKVIAVGIARIANDIRWLASGPRCGIGEIHLPAIAPGSSIMPGKVNPVICEAAIQCAAQVMGNDAAVTHGGTGGFFEINLMQPMIAHNLFASIELLSGSASLLAEKCVVGIVADEAKCEENVRKSLATVTGLVPHIGYDRAAEIAKKAHEQGLSIEEAAIAEKVIPTAELKKALYGE